MGFACFDASAKSTSNRLSYRRTQINGFVWDTTVNEPPIVAETTNSGGAAGRHHPLVWLLAAVLFLEAAALAVVTIGLVVELLVDRPDSFVSAVGLIVCAAIAATWVTAIAINSLRGRAWIRGASIVVQVLIAAVALGSFQGILPRADIGWLLLIPAIGVLVLLFTTPVLAETSRRDEVG
jgi:hypothetical protein